jgi:hypothetical protein
VKPLKVLAQQKRQRAFLAARGLSDPLIERLGATLGLDAEISTLAEECAKR